MVYPITFSDDNLTAETAEFAEKLAESLRANVYTSKYSLPSCMDKLH